MENLIKWNTTSEEDELINKIEKRAQSELDIRDDMNFLMDITATHCNGTPIDFGKLLAFDKFNFSHDIYGIINHIDRRDGKLKQCFLPRSAK